MKKVSVTLAVISTEPIVIEEKEANKKKRSRVKWMHKAVHPPTIMIKINLLKLKLNIRSLQVKR